MGATVEPPSDGEAEGAARVVSCWVGEAEAEGVSDDAE